MTKKTQHEMLTENMDCEFHSFVSDKKGSAEFKHYTIKQFKSKVGGLLFDKNTPDVKLEDLDELGNMPIRVNDVWGFSLGEPFKIEYERIIEVNKDDVTTEVLYDFKEKK